MDTRLALGIGGAATFALGVSLYYNGADAPLWNWAESSSVSGSDLAYLGIALMIIGGAILVYDAYLVFG